MTHSYKLPNGTPVLVICDEPDSECSCCHAQAECRPYGKDGASVCFDCAMSTPENKAEAERQLDKVLDGAEMVTLQ